MKKISFLILALALLLALTGCASSDQNSNTPTGNQDNNVQVNNPPENEEQDEDTASKILVAYFSATNNTAGIATEIAERLGADLYAITPADPYTAADLNYGDDNSRTSIEMNDPDSRPAIGGSAVENMADYDVVFLGYPIWWGQAPKIICTFIESYDFSGKTIVPFCTSGSSGIGSSATNLHSLADNATWLAGQRFSGSASHDSIVEWLNSLELTADAE